MVLALWRAKLFDMRNVIVGTAGHIDHGKTALVRALTGIDTDRLEEEKRRGITIDLGFAHLEEKAPSGEEIRFGFIDVPGHEKFVRNMLAGVGGIDMVLLIISADEGVKPQTREHFDIIRMLNIRHGITVLTKADLVDSETLGVVKLEVAEFLKGSFLDTTHAPLVAVSSLQKTGFDELRKQLVNVAMETTARSTTSAMRLPIDRVFTMKGFGTVITGTMISGRLKKEDEVELLPAGRKLRVRGVQVHGSQAETAQAAQRTALNLAGVAQDDLSRGMTLATPGLLRTTRRMDVSLTLLGSAKTLKDRARVHLHAFSSETVAEVVLIGAKEAKAGATVYAQLRAAEPLALAPGDRFIVRQFSPVITIGGGVVLDVAPGTKKVGLEARTEFLRTIESGNVQEALLARVTRRGVVGLSLADAIAESGMLVRELQPSISELKKRDAIVQFGDALVAHVALLQAEHGVLTKLTGFHDANRLKEGISKEELREQTGLGAEFFAGVLDALVREKKIEISGELVRAAGRGVAMKSDESESKRQIEEAFEKAGLKVPALKEVLATVKVDRARAQQIVTLLLRDKTLMKLSDDLVFHKSALDALRAQMATLKASSPKIDIARFKDATGVSRKYAIPLLEWLDRERVTKRVGDAREIL
jgi:selenocysteine-specific elongation factor